jgi:hypothetical protein
MADRCALAVGSAVAAFGIVMDARDGDFIGVNSIGLVSALIVGALTASAVARTRLRVATKRAARGAHDSG